MMDAIFATAVIVAVGSAGLYWYACAVAEDDLKKAAPDYAGLIYRDRWEAAAMRAPPVRLHVLLRENVPSHVLDQVSPLRILGLIHLATLGIALICFALWMWLR